jgi:hypothetical protein
MRLGWGSVMNDMPDCVGRRRGVDRRHHGIEIAAQQGHELNVAGPAAACRIETDRA